jgi:hypothetical protein
MTNCCPNNNCVEIVPSGCVKYTGTPTTGGLIDSFDSCDPYLNDLLKLLDDNVTSLDARVGLNKTTFDAANTACGLTPVISTTGLTVKDDKYYSSEVVIKLIGVICELRSRMNYLSSENINTNNGNIHWLDLPLDGKVNLGCLTTYCDTLNRPILTLKDLLNAIIEKIC